MFLQSRFRFKSLSLLVVTKKKENLTINATVRLLFVMNFKSLVFCHLQAKRISSIVDMRKIENQGCK